MLTNYVDILPTCQVGTKDPNRRVSEQRARDPKSRQNMCKTELMPDRMPEHMPERSFAGNKWKLYYGVLECDSSCVFCCDVLLRDLEIYRATPSIGSVVALNLGPQNHTAPNLSSCCFCSLKLGRLQVVVMDHGRMVAASRLAQLELEFQGGNRRFVGGWKKMGETKSEQQWS